MHRITSSAVVVVLAASSALALDVKSPGEGWTEAYRRSELVIFTRDVEQGRRIVAVAEVAAPPEAVFNAVTDVGHFADFMPYVEESRIISRESDSEVITYARLAPPFVSKRDYPLRVRMMRGLPANASVFKVEWTISPEALPEVEGVVRVKLNDGSWLAEPLHDGKHTRLTYSLLAHPGGLIPVFVANLSTTVAIPELFKAVTKRAIEKAAFQK